MSKKSKKKTKKDIKEYKEVQSLVLSKRDFDKVTNEISNPSGPNEKLVNAFKANKSVIEDERVKRKLKKS